MRHISKILTAVAAALLLAGSCTEKGLDGGSGFIQLSADIDGTCENVFTKSAPESGQVFAMRLKNQSGRVVATFEDISVSSSTPFKVEAGTYTAEVYTDVVPAAFDAPAYSGTQKITVRKDEITSVNVTCRLANTKVSVKFDNTVSDNFDDYSLSVTNGEGTLVFGKAGGTLDSEGFFAVTGKLTWTLSLKNKDGKVTENITDTYTGVKAGQHYNLSFSLKEESFGGGAFDIVLDDSYNEKVYDICVDLDADKHPSIYSETFELQAVNTVYEGLKTDGRFIIGSAVGLSSIKVCHTDDVLAGTGLAAENEFVGADAAKVEEYGKIGIAVPAIAVGDKEAVIDFSDFLASLRPGTYCLVFKIAATDSQTTEQRFDFVVKPSSAVVMKTVVPWARFASVEAAWLTESKPEGLSFQYRAAGSETWTLLEQTSVTVDDGAMTFSADITGLEPGGSYEVMAVTADDRLSRPVSFVTDLKTGSVPNMGFDAWYKTGKSWYPNPSASEWVWDTANEGANTMSAVNPTSPEYSDLAVAGEGKAAARLESKTVFGNFAAGNIYTGDFGRASISPVGATLQWGVAFDSRPYALKGYYKYMPKTINYAGGPYADMKGKTDEMMIQVFLTDWDAPFNINTGTGTFVSLDDPHIIAYGSLASSDTDSGYVEFVMPLEYRDRTRTPKYVVIVAAASRYGDYFTGGEGSVLLLDEFSFVYDPLEIKKIK